MNLHELVLLLAFFCGFVAADSFLTCYGNFILRIFFLIIHALIILYYIRFRIK
jgi:hypothetical protein